MRIAPAIAAVLVLVLPLAAKKQERNWQEGKVVDVQKPGAPDTSNAPTNPVGSVTQAAGDRPSVPVLESTGRGEPWLYLIEVAGRKHLARYLSPGRKSFLGTLAPGMPVKAFLDRRTLYLLDPKGKEWKLRLLEK